MGYCPFKYWLGWAQGARHGTGAGTGARACGASRRGRSAQGAVRQAGWGARPGVLLGQLAVHLVHATCF